MITIKSDKIFEGLMLHLYPLILVEMSLFVSYLFKQHHTDAIVTSAFREGDSGVHGYFRGIDFRSWGLSEEMCNNFCSEVNKLYTYDPKRPSMVCLMFHDTGRGPHLHLQCHPNTIKTEEEK